MITEHNMGNDNEKVNKQVNTRTKCMKDNLDKAVIKSVRTSF